jgi:hypothetical protein
MTEIADDFQLNETSDEIGRLGWSVLADPRGQRVATTSEREPIPVLNALMPDPDESSPICPVVGCEMENDHLHEIHIVWRKGRLDFVSSRVGPFRT